MVQRHRELSIKYNCIGSVISRNVRDANWPYNILCIYLMKERYDLSSFADIMQFNPPSSFTGEIITLSLYYNFT